VATGHRTISVRIYIYTRVWHKRRGLYIFIIVETWPRTYGIDHDAIRFLSFPYGPLTRFPSLSFVSDPAWLSIDVTRGRYLFRLIWSFSLVYANTHFGIFSVTRPETHKSVGGFNCRTDGHDGNRADDHSSRWLGHYGQFNSRYARYICFCLLFN